MQIIHKSKKNNSMPKSNAGFAMLFAVLTSSLLVSIGISIFSISLKELMIATAAQDSQKAYYVADSAVECALYWDFKIGSFPTCLDSGCSSANVSTSSTNTIICNGNPITLNFGHNNADYDAQTFGYSTSTFFKYSVITDPDSGIKITKTFTGSGNTSNVQTIIEAQGHNTGILGRRVERGIRQAYNSN